MQNILVIRNMKRWVKLRRKTIIIDFEEFIDFPVRKQMNIMEKLRQLPKYRKKTTQFSRGDIFEAKDHAFILHSLILGKSTTFIRKIRTQYWEDVQKIMYSKNLFDIKNKQEIWQLKLALKKIIDQFSNEIMYRIAELFKEYIDDAIESVKKYNSEMRTSYGTTTTNYIFHAWSNTTGSEKFEEFLKNKKIESHFWKDHIYTALNVRLSNRYAGEDGYIAVFKGLVPHKNLHTSFAKSWITFKEMPLANCIKIYHMTNDRQQIIRDKALMKKYGVKIPIKMARPYSEPDDLVKLSIIYSAQEEEAKKKILEILEILENIRRDKKIEELLKEIEEMELTEKI
jgi:hypothetical protein